jgi:valyl-tRNA synthetase
MSVVIGNSPGNDMHLYEEKIKGYRNFTNKLWNASRFVLGIIEEKGIKEMPAINQNNLSDADQWILGKLNDVITKVDDALMDFNISGAGQLLYDFLWNDFCDWYLELSKGEKQNLGVLCTVLRDTLTMLHPLMPFITEQIWSQLPGNEGMLIHAEYPKSITQKYKGDATESVISVVTAIRKLRAENGVEAAAKISAVVYGHSATEKLKGCTDDIIRLARLSDLKLEENGEKPDKAVTDIVGGIEIYLRLEGLVDTEKEKIRLKKEVEQLEKYIATLSAKLMNKNFVQSAPLTIVEAEKSRLKESEEKKAKLEEQMKGL